MRFAACAARSAAIALSLGAVACAGSASPPASPHAEARAATLYVEGTSGADLAVDGVYVGTLPLASPVVAEPGPHEIVVTSNGHHPEARTVELGAGRTERLTVELDETGQRAGAWVALASGAGWVSVGVVFGVLAIVEDRNARDLVQRLDGGVTASETTSYEQALGKRDLYRTGAGIAVGSGLAFFVVGACLFAFDERPAPGTAGAPQVTVVPVVDPTFAGGAAEVRF